MISFLLLAFLPSSTFLEDGSFSMDWDGTVLEAVEDSSLLTLSLSCLRIFLIPSMPEFVCLESFASLSSR